MWYRVLLTQAALLPLLRCNPSATEHRDLFISCDKDADRRVSIAELEACMGSIRGSTSGDSERDTDLNNILSSGPSLLQRDKHAALNIMKMFDADRDDVITLREYQHVLSRSKAGSGSGADDDYVDVLRADGSTQRMLLADMFEMAQEPLKDFKMRDNQLYREESKVNVSLDAVRRDNPSLANMISIGEWSFNQLRKAADSLVNDRSLVGLVSLPTGGSAVDERTYLKDRKDSLKEEAELIRSDNLFKGDFELWLLLSIKDRVSDSVVLIEVHVAYSKEAYLKPYLALLEAWEIQSHEQEKRQPGYKRVRSIDLPAPRLRLPFFRWCYDQVINHHAKNNALVAGIVIAAVLLMVSIIYELR